jgi:hypothetical protein
MADPPRQRSLTNPFYVLLLLASTAFLVTTFGYLVSPFIQQRAQAHAGDVGGPGPASLALAHWLDRTAPTALAVEIAAMLVSGLLAMVTDRWFSAQVARPASKPAPRRDI